MTRKTVARYLVALLLLLSPLSGQAATSGAAAPGPAAEVSVEIVAWPNTVQMGDAITIHWRVTGGASVSQTRIEWGLQSGLYIDGQGDTFSGAPGEYHDTFSVPYAGALYVQAMAQVDGTEYRSAEKTVSVACVASFSGNHDHTLAASIAANRTYIGCGGNANGDWYVVNIPACTSMVVYADPSPGPVGGGQGVVLEVYDSSGTQIASRYPDCGGGYGRCDTVSFAKSFPQAGALYLQVWGNSDSYELVVNTSSLALRSDEFIECTEGPGGGCWMPWYWHWTDPLGGTEYDPTRAGDVWWMSAPGDAIRDLHDTTNAPRYTQSMCGDFAVQTDVGLGRTGSYQSAGLLVWKDAQNFLRWEVNDWSALRALRMRGGVWTDSGDLEYPAGRVRLHVQRVGQRIDCFAYVAGGWKHYRSWDLTSGAVEVGLFVVNAGPATAASATFDYFRVVSPLALPTTPTATPGTPVAGFVWRAEAESGQVMAPMAVRADGAACGGQYVSSQDSNAGQVSYALSVPQAGEYYLWARARGNQWTGNSFSVAFDGAESIVYEIPPFGEQWVFGWDQVHQVDQPENPFALSAGAHTLYFRGREANAALDALLLTSDGGYVPSGCASAITATPSVTATRTATPTRTGTPMPPRLWLPMICDESRI